MKAKLFSINAICGKYSINNSVTNIIGNFIFINFSVDILTYLPNLALANIIIVHVHQMVLWPVL